MVDLVKMGRFLEGGEVFFGKNVMCKKPNSVLTFDFPNYNMIIEVGTSIGAFVRGTRR